MSYPVYRIVVVDERGAPRNDDNLSEEENHLVEQADVIISVGPDGVYSKSNLVDVVTPKSEAQMSHEKAVREASDFEQRYRQPQEGEDPAEKFGRVWQGDSNSGTEQIKGV